MALPVVNEQTTQMNFSESPPRAEAPQKLLKPKDILAFYERKLSVCGDDRRLGDSCDYQRYVETKEEAPTGFRARMRSIAPSRTKETLMQTALERTLQEKALFRAPSKEEAPSFAQTTWSGNGRSEEESLDPFDVRFVDPDQRKGAPDSWCRWPTYSRSIRGSVAGPDDHITTQDFGRQSVSRQSMRQSIAQSGQSVDRQSLERQSLERQSIAGHDRQVGPTKGRLKSISRYYTDLLSTSSFNGKGHRTSIWGSGKLKEPDLEILPASLPIYPEPSRAPSWVDHDGTFDTADLQKMYSECVRRPSEAMSLDSLSGNGFLRETFHDLLRLDEEEELDEQDSAKEDQDTGKAESSAGKEEASAGKEDEQESEKWTRSDSKF